MSEQYPLLGYKEDIAICLRGNYKPIQAKFLG